MKFPNSELWCYSTQVYTIVEVEKSCLQLQNEFEADVNILLYCCWAGEKKCLLNNEELSAIQTVTTPWQRILKPLRDARQMMKQHVVPIPADQRQQTVTNMSELELNAEHMEQLALESCIDFTAKTPSSEQSSADCCAQNLFVYLQLLDAVNSTNDITEWVTTLLNGIYQDDETVQMALMVAAAG